MTLRVAPIRSPSSRSMSSSFKVNWKLKNGDIFATDAVVGIPFLELAHRNNIDLEGIGGYISYLIF